MTRKVSGIHAPASRPTIRAAWLLALYLALPVVVVLSVVELWLRFG